jgi:hypothetical protein
MDSFRKSMESYWFGDHKSWLLKIQFGDHETNPDFKRLDSNHWSQIQHIFKDTTCFHKSKESSQIFSTIPQNKSLKMKIRKSLFLTNPDWQTRESKFANPDPKDLIPGFISKSTLLLAGLTHIQQC